MIELEVKKLEFFSEKDEAAFFNWANSIKAVDLVRGEGFSIYLSISNIDDTSLREIISLFFRYKIDMKQIKKIINSDNIEWIKNPLMFWYKPIFDT